MTPSQAGSPFDRPEADIVLRSQDGVTFRTLRSILSSSSNYFETMFRMPQPTSRDSDQEFFDGLPMLSINAPSLHLKELLFYCHPPYTITSPNPLQEVQELAMFLQMYEVAWRILKDRMEKNYPSRQIIPRLLDTIRERIGSSDEIYLGQAAVTKFLSSENEEAKFDGLDLVTKDQYDSLKRYRDDCCKAAADVASPTNNHFKWLPDHLASYHWLDKNEARHNTRSYRDGKSCECETAGIIFIGNASRRTVMTRRWWMDYVKETKDELLENPCGVVAMSGHMYGKAVERAQKCECCREAVEKGKFWEFSAVFAEEIDKAVSAVELGEL